MRRRFKAVMDILDAMIRYGVSLSRSVELTAQWDLILALGPMYPVSLDDLSAGCNLGLGVFFHVASDVHRRLGDFIHQVVVHRRDEAIVGWRKWIRDYPLVHPYRWLRPDLVPPAPFLQCKPVLADVVQRKGAAAGSLDGWSWRELKALPVSWFDELARILTKVEDIGVWPDGLLDAYIAVIPKTDGDATPLGQRPLSVLPIVYRIWASARMGQLEGWFRSWVPDSVFSAGEVVVGRWRPGILLLWILSRFLLGLLTPMFTLLLLMSLSLLIRLIGVF